MKRKGIGIILIVLGAAWIIGIVLNMVAGAYGAWPSLFIGAGLMFIGWRLRRLGVRGVGRHE